MFWLVLAGLVVAVFFLVVVAYLLVLVNESVGSLTSILHATHEADLLARDAIRERDELISERDAQLEQLLAELEAATSTSTAPLLGERVVVNLTDGSSIRGVLAADYAEAIVLEAAEYLAGQQPEAFAGRAVIPRPHLIWTQALGAD